MDDKKTMTAEEVEQSRKRLSQGLHKHLGDYDRDEQAALTRLAAQAARVPGLAKELDEAKVCAEGREVLVDLRVGPQPPPATAQGVDVIKAQILTINQEVNAAEAAHAELDKRGVPRDSADDEMPPGAELSLAERIRRLSPTPPPGLREAVAPLAKLARKFCADPLYVDFKDDDSVNGVTMGDWRRLRAAYDATGGEHGPDSTCPNCKADHEDAAKYRAAVKLAKDSVALGKAAYEGQSGTPEAEWIVPWEQFVAFDREMHTRQGVAVAQRLLCLTLTTPPSGPGGGERSQDAVDADFATWQAEQPTRARIAPTPTPEVPPLVESPPDTSSVGAEYSQGFGDGWTKRGARMRLAMSSRDVAMRRLLGAVGKLVSVYSEISGESPAETAASFEPSLSPAPESAPDSNSPQTPSVAREGDGVRVKTDGSAWDTHEHRAPWQVTEILARALAEAKREAEPILKALKQMQRRDEATLHETLERLLHERATLPITESRKAAESMRERAATAAGTARHSVVVDESFATYAKACDDIMQRILKLPLE